MKPSLILAIAAVVVIGLGIYALGQAFDRLQAEQTAAIDGLIRGGQ